MVYCYSIIEMIFLQKIFCRDISSDGLRLQIIAGAPFDSVYRNKVVRVAAIPRFTGERQNE